jgi:hypothetical protein
MKWRRSGWIRNKPNDKKNRQIPIDLPVSWVIGKKNKKEN